MVKPITPSEVETKRLDTIPDVVVAAFNDLIVKNMRGNSARVTQDEAVEAITRSDPEISRSQIFTNGWLDVEPLFRRAGWNVKFDKPGYNESYGAYFVFSRE